jgi:tetratricopeptide (TPR) repeat protein
MKRIMLLLAGSLILTTQNVAAQTSASGEVVQPLDVYIRSAKIALATNPPEYDRALRNLHTARDNYPKNSQVHFLLGSVWADKDEIDSMITEYDLARKYAPAKEWEKEAKSVEKIKDSKWVERFNRSVSLINQSDSTDELASRHDTPVNSDSLKGVANQIRAMAKETLRQCALLKPDDFRAFSTRGLIYQRQGSIDSSLADFVIAESLFNRNDLCDSTANWYDTTQFFTGPVGSPTPVFDEYLKRFKKLTEEKKTRYRNLMVSLAACYYDKQMWERSVALNRRLHGLDPNDINAIVTLADIFSRLGNEPEAFKWQEAVVSRDPGSKDTWYNMGIFYYNAAVRIQDSVSKYDREVRKSPGDSGAVAMQRLYSGKRRESFEKATPRFSKVVDLDPKDQDTWRLLAICQFSMENWSDAYPTLQKATTLYPDDKNLCQMMKVTLAQLGKTDELKTWSAKCP